MLRFLLAGLSLLTLTLALTSARPASAHAAAGMELALQDDAVFVDQRWMERDRALDHAVELGATRIRVNVLWARMLVADADARTTPEDRSPTTSAGSTRCRPRRPRAASSCS